MLRGALVLFVLSSTASAGLIDLKGKPIDEFTFAIEGRLWRSELRGDLRVDDEFIEGTNVDFEEELNLDSEDWSPEAMMLIKAKNILIRGAYVETTFSETDTVDETFRFDGSTFTFSERVDAEVTFRIGGAEIEWLFLNLGSASKVGLEVGAGVGLRYLSVSARIESETTGIRERTRKNAVTPVVSVSASLGIFNVVRVDLNVAGIYFDYLGIEGLFLDGAIEAKLFVHHAFYVGLGYRYSGLDLEFRHGDNVEFNVNLGGSFIGAGLQF